MLLMTVSIAEASGIHGWLRRRSQLGYDDGKRRGLYERRNRVVAMLGIREGLLGCGSQKVLKNEGMCRRFISLYTSDGGAAIKTRFNFMPFALASATRRGPKWR